MLGRQQLYCFVLQNSGNRIRVFCLYFPILVIETIQWVLSFKRRLLKRPNWLKLVGLSQTISTLQVYLFCMCWLLSTTSSSKIHCPESWTMQFNKLSNLKLNKLSNLKLLWMCGSSVEPNHMLLCAASIWVYTVCSCKCDRILRLNKVNWFCMSLFLGRGKIQFALSNRHIMCLIQYVWSPNLRNETVIWHCSWTIVL